MSHCIRKPTKCFCENKGTDQLSGNREADQLLCFRCTDSTILLLLKSEISCYPASVTVQAGLCQTWSEPKLFSHAQAQICFQAGALLACGIVNSGVRNECDPALALLSDYVSHNSSTMRTGAIVG